MAVDTDYSLVTLVELQDFLAGSDGDYPSDADLVLALETTIDGVSKWMHEYTGRQLKSKEITEYYNGDGTQLLYLSSWPITASAIYVDNDHDFGAETAITYDSLVDNELYYASGFPVGVKNVKAVYTAGWADGSVPADLRNACLIMCQLMDMRQKKGAAGTTSVAIAGNTIQFDVERLAPPFVMDVLNRYRTVSV